jgi:hypothetical protein
VLERRAQVGGGAVSEEWFESDPIKAIFGFDGIVRAYLSLCRPHGLRASPSLLWRGEWQKGESGVMGAITQRLRACAAR